MRSFLLLIPLLLLPGCQSDNAYDGENGLVRTAANLTGSLQQINDDVLSVQAQTLVERTTATIADLEALVLSPDAVTLAQAQSAFVAQMQAWKQVEALYVADDYDSALIDVPALTDYFHIGNTDLPATLDKVFESNKSLDSMLFQSSTRSITALEYTLFGDGSGEVNMTVRRAEAALVMADYQLPYYESINTFYAAADSFVDGGEESTGVVINQLIDSAYKLKEWRIGEAAGLVQSYLDDPDPSRLEYYYSGTSREAMRAILEAHLAIMQNGLGSIASQNSAQSEAEAVLEIIDTTLAMLDAIPEPLADVIDSEALSDLYDSVNTLQTGYTAMVSALNVQQTIIEADGD